ncbi:MAG: DUF5115 domain-containing protein [Bacteroidaceae bacterium]|nr:DUF5115 domain-containing protein [Bacteroidaceae bacterium]
MKKLSLYMLLGAMTFMAACNEDFNEDVAAPQGWDQVSAIKVAGFTAKAADVVNLGEAKGDSVAALNVTLPNSLPYGVTLANLKLVLTPEGSSNTYTINAGPTGKVAVADLQEVINTEYGLRPDTRTFSAELTADYMDGGQAIVATGGTVELKAIAAAPIIEDVYYYVGAANGWSDSDQTYPLKNSGADVYEDPIFVGVVPAPTNEDGSRADNWFKIAPASAYESEDFWGGLLGAATDGDGTLQGRFVTKDAQAWNLPASDGAKTYVLKLDMLSGTYEFTPYVEDLCDEYYYVGALNGWSDSDKTYQLTNSGVSAYLDPIFSIVIPAPVDDNGNRVDNWFKLAPGTAYGDNFWGSLICAADNGDESLKGQYVIGDAGAFNQPASDGATYYRISINVLAGTWEFTPMAFKEYIYEIGNESSWSTAHALRSANYDGKYVGYYWLDGEYKFKPNEDNWDGDWEYVDGNKITDAGGPNMPGVAAGFYMIKVDLGEMTFETTPFTVSIIGSANGAWDTDTDLTYNAEEGCFEVTTTLNDGEFKFRANHDWGINWGGEPDSLSQDGPNIGVAAGTYLIKFYLDGATGTAHYTISAK